MHLNCSNGHMGVYLATPWQGRAKKNHLKVIKRQLTRA